MTDLVSLFQKIKPAVVAIAPRPKGPATIPPAPMSVVGSGFCVDPLGIVVTARHVMEPISMMAPIVVFFYSDVESNEFKLYKCPLFFRAPVDDLDLVVSRVWNPPVAFPSVALKVDERVTEGTRVVSCGFPMSLVFSAGGPPQRGMESLSSIFQSGIVASVVPLPGIPVARRESYLLDMSLNPGNSGGPIFLEDGTVVGVVVSGPQPFSPVVDKDRKETGNYCAVPSGLTNALPVSAALLEVIDKVRAMTPEELDQKRAYSLKHHP